MCVFCCCCKTAHFVRAILKQFVLCTNWKTLHLTEFFTEPAVVMVVTNIRYGCVYTYIIYVHKDAVWISDEFVIKTWLAWEQTCCWGKVKYLTKIEEKTRSSNHVEDILYRLCHLFRFPSTNKQTVKSWQGKWKVIDSFSLLKHGKHHHVSSYHMSQWK